MVLGAITFDSNFFNNLIKSFYEKIKFLSPHPVNVLIVDEEGNHQVKACIPKNVTFSILPLRGVIPVVASFKFIFRLFAHSVNLKRIQDAILFSIIDVLKPKILITKIDNSLIMGRLHEEFPNKLTISVQNGFRSGPKYSGSYGKSPVSLFYGFGEHDGKRQKSMGIEHEEYVSSGSLVYGLYKKNQINQNVKNKYDVCLISQLSLKKDRAGLVMVDNLQDIMFLDLVKACKELNLSLAVAMRYEEQNPHYALEFNQLSAIDTEGIAKLIPNNFAISEGYNVSFQSNILISVNSTLGYEMLGAGKKVLFGASIDNFALAHSWDSLDNFNQLPSMNLLDSHGVDALRSKLSFLIDMDHREYLNQTAYARKYYMNHFETIATHELIKNKMAEFLSST